MATPADIAEDVALAPEPLAYATATGNGPTLTDLQPALSKLLGIAVLSGLCVGSCFLLFTDAILAGVLHLGIYAAILFLAVRSGIDLGKVGFARTGLLTLDGVAGLGLVVIGLAPLGLWLNPRSEQLALLGALLLAGAFTLLALTSGRHREFYRKLSYPVRAAGYGKTAKWLAALGWIKSIYETIWLLCCAVPLAAVSLNFLGSMRRTAGAEVIALYSAFAAFFGCLGFAVIWIVMIVLHARVLRLSRVQRPVGFEVLMPQPVVN